MSQNLGGVEIAYKLQSQTFLMHCLRHLLVGREAWEITPTTCSNFFMILIKRFLKLCMILVFYENIHGLYNGATRANLLQLLIVCFIIFVCHFGVLFFCFFPAGNLWRWWRRKRERNVERERERERGKWDKKSEVKLFLDLEIVLEGNKWE